MRLLNDVADAAIISPSLRAINTARGSADIRRAYQVTISATANVKIEARVGDDAWVVIKTITASEIDFVDAYPDVRFNVDSNTGTVRVTIDKRQMDVVNA